MTTDRRDARTSMLVGAVACLLVALLSPVPFFPNLLLAVAVGLGAQSFTLSRLVRRRRRDMRDDED